MAFPVIGQTVHLEITEGYFAGRYQARVQDADKHAFYIDLPLKPSAKMPTNLPEGQSVIVQYRSVDGAQCSFESRVTGRDVRQIQLLALHKPDYSNIRRQQRREFLRVPIQSLFHLIFVEEQTKTIVNADAHGYDISGGGLSIRVKKDVSIHSGDIIGFRFLLPTEGKTYEIVGKGRVIRVAQPDASDHKLVSMKYYEIAEGDRQRIIQYSFKRQIEMRERGVLG